MKINLGFKKFKRNHSKKKHQILFRSRSCNQYYKVENLFRFLLAEKNSFIFESVEKGTIKGRYRAIYTPKCVCIIYDTKKACGYLERW